MQWRELFKNLSLVLSVFLLKTYLVREEKIICSRDHNLFLAPVHTKYQNFIDMESLMHSVGNMAKGVSLKMEVARKQKLQIFQKTNIRVRILSLVQKIVVSSFENDLIGCCINFSNLWTVEKAEAI